MINLFKKIITEHNRVLNPADISLGIQFGKPTDDKVSQLLKKATALKKSDIGKAIELVKEASKIDPKYPCNDKLKSYLILANRLDEAEELVLKLIRECQSNSYLFNFRKRADSYRSYADLLFKKESFKEYIFYYSLSFYNELVADALNEQYKSVKANLTYLKNKEIFTDKKTNKAFQEVKAKQKQDLFLQTFTRILLKFDLLEFCKLVLFLINKQPNKQELEIYATTNGKEDWLLWSSEKFQETIPNYYEDVFIRLYRSELEPLLN